MAGGEMARMLRTFIFPYDYRGLERNMADTTPGGSVRHVTLQTPVIIGENERA